MSFEVTIVCDGCSVIGGGASLGGGKKLRREMGKNGWTSRKVDGEQKDFCGDCTRAGKTSPR